MIAIRKIIVVALAFGVLVPPSYAQVKPSTPVLKSSDEPQLHGRKLVEAYCASCHGVDGNSTDPQYPKIAGQKAYYLRSQLRAFKSGARKSDVMSGLASTISDAQIVELSRYFSDQVVKPDKVKDPQLAAVGEEIYRYPSHGVPPCAACHAGRGFGPGFGPGGMMGGHGMMGGPGMMGRGMGMMMGNTATVPRLNGQHADYIVRQLDAFASGARQDTVMGPIADRLSERDRRAVAEYLSSLR
jgi:cytochrome c553